MKALFLAAAALVLAASAHAADPAAKHYFGLNLTTPGEANFDINGRNVANDNHPRAVKLYAGLQFTPTWGAEAGYGAFGSWHAADPAPGASYQTRLGSKVVYLAGRATMPLGESFALFGKAGLALNRLSQHDSLGHAARENFVRPMAGGGLEWRLAPQVSATAEYAYYGSRRGDGDRFTQQKAEVGLAFKF
ncbi:outer membrane beta-barrel protein [Roseateles sp.]|uniref:outer membrane beta-barrel protein n=1 Tax=Roseateles sp. TaxID=1971397 RepID=UPI003264222B